MNLLHTLRSARAALLAIAGVAAVVTATLAPQTDAFAAMSKATATRNAECDALVTRIGTGGIMQLRSGVRPASANVAATGTLLATLTWTGVNIGTCTNGTLTVNTGAATQTAASHQNGTPGHVRILQSNGTTVVLDIDICGTPPCWTFAGTVTTGQPVTFPTTLTISEGSL